MECWQCPATIMPRIMSPSLIQTTPTRVLLTTTLSYLVQMLGLTVQNFVTAAAGMATLVAFTWPGPAHGADHRQFLG
jgi:hypothetical protein